MGTDASQLSLAQDEYEPPKHRVEALARILAGFQFPHVGFERLTKPQQHLVYETARDALKRLATEAE